MTLIKRNAVLALAVVLLVLGLVAWVLAMSSTSGAADNKALTDQEATTQVQNAVSDALTNVLTYDHSKPEVTEQAVDASLEGKARDEYNTLFATLKERAPDQKLVLTASVQASAVKKLQGDDATLLVFLDQKSKRSTDKQATVSAAQLSVTAKKTDGTWKITQLRPL